MTRHVTTFDQEGVGKCPELLRRHLETSYLHCALFLFFYKIYRNRIYAAEGPWVTAADATHGKPRTSENSKTTDCFVGVLGAGGVEFAARLVRETTERAVI
jgi:hypothetical protein